MHRINHKKSQTEVLVHDNNFFYKYQSATNMTGNQMPKDKVLHMLSDFVDMRFTLRNNKTFMGEKTRANKHMLDQQNQPSRPASTANTPTKEQKPSRNKPLIKQSMLANSQKNVNKEQVDETYFRLKFLQRLSEEYLIIGNQYQIDMLKIGGSIDGFLDVQHKWSINPQGVVHTIAVERKFSLIALGSKHQVQVYRYDLKKDHQQPKIIVNCIHKDDQILEVRFIKNAGIYIVFKKKIEYRQIVWLCDKAELIKCLQYKIQMKKNMSIFAVPNAFDNTLNLYFEQKKEQSDKFDLWMQSFVSLARADTPQVSKMIRIYSLDEDLKDKIQIFNYNSEICLIQFQNKLIAFKNGFVIDAVSTNIHQPNYFIKYVSSKRTLFHFLDNVIDIYYLSMIEKTKPEKFRLLTRDCIEFTHKNSGKLFSILHLGQDNFAFFFQTANSRTSSDHPSIRYRFAITQQVNLLDKLDRIYPSSEDMNKLSFQQLYEKSNIAQKMGLSKRDAFLQLWLRSKKTSIIDFQVLLSTRHFSTIQTQIQQKMKRQSMSVREILKIYGQCLTMLQQRVYSQNCKQQDLRQYTSCQFLIRKLEMLRWIQSQGSAQEGTLMVNVKDYYEYKDLSVIPAIANLVYEYIHHPKPQVLLKLKAIFKYFRLICKIQYQEILTSLINKCQLKFLEILKVMPDLLPYQTTEQEEGSNLWKPIQEQQLDQNIFLSQMVTIDNRERIQEFPISIWFKRYQYSNHGVIKEVDRKNLSSYLAERYNFQSVFYMFLCKVYDLNIINDQLRHLIIYAQQKYDLMPEHLKGKLQLYFLMYLIFAQIGKSLTLYQFLKLKQHQLFKLYFQREKAEKGGFILKKIKPLYEQLLNKGKQVFNQGMYDFFSSQQSTVSDLKCILSKLNNEKNEFHISSEQLYQVLINAIMQKIKVGSNQDTPIDQILVYIQNIPFPIHNECIMTNLQYIQQVNFESEMLRRIHVNMTLAQIVKNGQTVIQMMVDHQIQRHQMHRIRDYRSLRLHAYKILAEIQCRKSNIYGENFHSYSLKIFLINIMGNNDMIPLCKQLLSDKYLIEQFQIDDAFKQSVVMHLYQWRLSHKTEHVNAYKNHLQFLNLLMELLNRSNTKRKFIQASMKYAALFTLPSYQIQYPLFPTFKYYPALLDIEILLDKLNAADLTKVDLQKVFDVMMGLKKLGQAEMNANFTIDGYQNKLKLELYQIYLIKLVKERQLKLALKFAEIMLDIPNEYSQFNIIYPILIIERTYEEVIQNTAALINRLISFLFKSPRQLCKLLSRIYSTRLSNSELDQLLQGQLKKRENQLAFSLNNPILRDQMKKPSQPKQRNKLLEICLQRVLASNEAYGKNYCMQIVFRLMCHEPLAMAKWMWCKGSGINMKTLRSFVSFMTLEALFDADATLQATIDVLQVLIFKYTNNIFFSEILKFKNHLTNRTINNYNQTPGQNNQAKVITLISQSIQILKRKRQQVQVDQTGVFKQKEKQNWNQLLSNPLNYIMRAVSEYAYSDRDDAYEDMNDELSIKSKWKSKNDSKSGKKSQKAGQRIYEEIPLPTAHRHRKNSEYFPEMLDVQQNFDSQRTLKPSQSSEHFPTISYQIKINYPVDRIQEDEGQNLNSMIAINLQSSKTFQKGPQILQRLKKSDSICIQGFQSEESYNNSEGSLDNFSFKIQVNGQGHIDAKELVTQMFNTIQGQNGVYDLSLLKIQSRKNEFRDYLQQVLEQAYKNKDFSHLKRMKLVNMIADEYQWSENLNKEAVAVFKRLQTFKGIQLISLNFKEALPIDMLFSQNLQDYFPHYFKILTTGINSLQVFPRVKFTQDVVSRQWKQRILQSLIMQKIQNIRTLKQKLSDVDHKQVEGKKILKQLEMEQLKISVMVDQNESLIKRLEKKCHQLQQSKSEHKQSAGQILKMGISAIKYNI